MKRLVSVLVFVVFGALTVPCFGQGMKLHIAHWNVPKDFNTKVLQTLAKDIEEASGGTIKTEISWQALGKPGDYYDALVNGLCDLALFGPTYSPGRFPMTEMMTLPIHYPNNRTVVMAYYRLWKKGYLNKEFEKFVPVAVGNNASFLFMWGKKPVDKLADLKGKKVSAPYTIHTKMVERAGATPVAMPVTEVYSALDTGVLDGTWQIWPAMPIFRFQEVVKFATDVSMSCGPYVIGVNKTTFSKLPEKVKKLLDEGSEKYSLMLADAFQEANDVGKKIFLDAGGKIASFSPEEVDKLNESFKPIFGEWMDGAKGRGLPAEKAIEELYNILVDLGVKKPFAR